MSIRMEWIVHIVYHSFPFAEQNSFTHSQQRQHAQPLKYKPAQPHIHTKAKTFTFMWTWNFMNEFLSRFSRQRTKYRLTYISGMSLFVHCWACSCISLSFRLMPARIRQTISFIFYIIFLFLVFFLATRYRSVWMTFWRYGFFLSPYIETMICYSFWIAIADRKIHRKTWMKLNFFFHIPLFKCWPIIPINAICGSNNLSYIAS